MPPKPPPTTRTVVSLCFPPAIVASYVPSMSDEAGCDVFVIFGITGDLARVMTYRSLYRLERRGLLDCPIVGVAIEDWTEHEVIERARKSIIATGEPFDEDVMRRLAARISYVSGD